MTNPDVRQEQSTMRAATPVEDRSIITPYAFEVSPELFGTPLATPAKRFLALMLDLLLIAALSMAPPFLLALVAAYVFWHASGKARKSHRLPYILVHALRLLATLMLFAVAYALLDDDSDAFVGLDDEPLSRAQGIAVSSLAIRYTVRAGRTEDEISSGDCPEALACWREFMLELGHELGASDLSPVQADRLVAGIFEGHGAGLSESEREDLLDTAAGAFEAAEETGGDPAEAETETPLPEFYREETEPGILSWLEAIAADLGLGFGWAAFYFTAFSAWWRGQTPAKRLLGLRIIKINGSGMNLWESFGRYGGYCAGLATGLLGFLQIFWDPNRQAIQDKISETVVIDLKAPRRAYEPPEPNDRPTA